MFLAQDRERLERFFALTGLDPATIRKAASEPGFLVAVLDHLMSDERLLMEFASDQGINPDMIPRARETLARGG